MSALIKECLHVLIACSLLLAATAVQAGSMLGSKHDLSLKGVNLCAYCHMPTSAQSSAVEAPLWSRNANLNTFNPYNSEAAKGVCLARPGGVSMVCLSCHDGTNGKAVFSEPQQSKARYQSSIANDERCLECHKVMPAGDYPIPLSMEEKSSKVGGAHKGMNHPVARQYPLQSGTFFSPPDAEKGWPDIRLYNGKVECPSCHAVHDPTVTPFLRVSNVGSAVCLRCHDK
jgi:predicted CXXCH cytochrome family protein